VPGAGRRRVVAHGVHGDGAQADGERRGGRGHERGERGASALLASHPPGQCRQDGDRELRHGRVLEHLGTDPAEQAGQAGELPHPSGARVAAGEVALEGQPLGRGEGTEHVGAVGVLEGAAHGGVHAVTPISSSARRSARRA
jgi:hypothetical protein